MTDRTVEEIASDAAETAGPDDATSPASSATSSPATDGAAASPSSVTDAGAPAAAVPPASAADAAGGGAVSKASVADVEEAMKDVVDPELGINVVDLGLVYDAHVDDDNVATLDMTLTSAACPLTDVIEDQTRQALTTGPGGGLVKDFRINWVWLPPWGPDKITDDGREQLRALGFNV
ncbi:metal-sulfur cluster assembly factor [Couchioplanes caeruleus]|uniref:metal-sulfur cluster assembly factor n=1 Tax=Couchioplanes caeruleus TaxID=56438 RepID=UPI0031F7C051